ncbi:relaxase/mobilization nuclease domain-containing protein [Acidovorax sp. CCYZU-2555]|uniref:relaxase/mobilization nuclease domain-containing protein n=1 Tax=Acidovorax sp. CCYZU-2555 TaxID=2835042 RepID=UPI001BCC23BC|nr:relaxase/mobilization nuclease domain-containing protein [Acidovorax sp. CCYZU-2555]MBS7776918.1 relaxase/mobilization nuclease domain-containing protein [Acidovorax sp. CCYZU-2555]
MIISTFKTGKGKSKGPLNYLLGNDKDNNPRNPAPIIVKGDKRLTEVLIDSNHRQYKYTSGAIAFRDNEKPTSQQLEKIISAFEKTFTPGLEERVPILWVKHEDKGNIELHFICPMQDSKTGKQFNICPPGNQFKQMFKDFQSLANDANDWEQVRPNLFKSQMTKFEVIAPEEKPLQLKKLLSSDLEKRVENGSLKNRNDFIELIKKIGFEITRVGKDYLSIKHPKANKATRLKGPAFSEGVFYSDLLNQSDKSAKLTDTERNDVKKRLARAMKNRQRSLLEYLDNAPKVVMDKKPAQEVIKLDASNISNVRSEPPQATPDLPEISSQRLKI